MGAEKIELKVIYSKGGGAGLMGGGTVGAQKR